MKRNVVVMLVVLTSVCSFATSYVGLPKGTIKGALVTYTDSDTITLTAGYGECNGNYWEITSPTVYDMNSLSTDQDYHYIYIDADSSFPAPTIIDVTTEPVWSNEKFGWYNGDNRCIGALWSPASSATILKFCSNSSQKFLYDENMKQVLSGGCPDGTWQTVECSYVTPVNAIAIHAHAGNLDDWPNGFCGVMVTCEDNSRPQLYGYGHHPRPAGWIMFNTGSSRDLRWLGSDDDDDGFFIWVTGYQIDR